MQGKKISIARDLLSHSLSTRLILFGRLIPAYVEREQYISDIIRTVIQEKWYYYEFVNGSPIPMPVAGLKLSRESDKIFLHKRD